MTITITTGRMQTAGSLLPLGATGLDAIVGTPTGAFGAPDSVCAYANFVAGTGHLIGILSTDARRDDRINSTLALDPLAAAV